MYIYRREEEGRREEAERKMRRKRKRMRKRKCLCAMCFGYRVQIKTRKKACSSSHSTAVCTPDSPTMCIQMYKVEMQKCSDHLIPLLSRTISPTPGVCAMCVHGSTDPRVQRVHANPNPPFLSFSRTSQAPSRITLSAMCRLGPLPPHSARAVRDDADQARARDLLACTYM